VTKQVAYLGVALATALSASVVGLPAASAASFGSLLQTASRASLVQPVGGDQQYVDEYDQDRDTQVRAPFTSVDTSKSKGTQVQAPFTSVETDDRGTYVRAPFVDLFVPRR
jgi:hypothetical protein